MQNLIVEKPRLLSEIVWAENNRKSLWEISTVYKVFKLVVNRLSEIYKKDGLLILNVAPENINIWRDEDKIAVDLISRDYYITKNNENKQIPPPVYEFLAPECHLWSNKKLTEKTLVYNLSLLLYSMCCGKSWFASNRYMYKSSYFHENLIPKKSQNSFCSDVLENILSNGLLLCEQKRYSFNTLIDMLK